MGLFHSTSIVSSNIALLVDPASARSYVGSGVTMFDVTGLGGTATLTNGPVYSSAFGGYLSYDGTNDYTNIPHSNNINISDNITVSMWCRMNNLTNSSYILSKMSGITGYHIGFDSTSKQMYVGIRNNAGDGYKSSVGSTTVRHGLWYQYALTKTGTAVSMYVNGEFSTGIALTYIGSLSNSNALTLGSEGTAYYTPCDISQVVVYNRRLNQEEIKQNYDATKLRYLYSVPIVNDGLILNLDAGNLISYSGSGVSWFDISGNNNNAVLYNGPTYSGSGSTAAIVFDGVNDYAQIDDNNLLRLSSIGTLNIWFKFNSTANQVLVSKGNVYADKNAYGIYTYNTQGIVGEIAQSSFNQLFTGLSYLTTGVWRMASITWDNSWLYLYINGAFIGKRTQNVIPDTSGFPFRIAGNGNTSADTYSSSSISSVLLYNRALSPSEVYKNFDSMRSRYGL